jgi:predicted site-specific integrase-resolvase
MSERPLAVDFARASTLTSLSKVTLRRYVRAGRIRTVLCGRRRIIPLTALADLVQNGVPSSGSVKET